MAQSKVEAVKTVRQTYQESEILGLAWSTVCWGGVGRKSVIPIIGHKLLEELSIPFDGRYFDGICLVCFEMGNQIVETFQKFEKFHLFYLNVFGYFSR